MILSAVFMVSKANIFIVDDPIFGFCGVKNQYIIVDGMMDAWPSFYIFYLF